MSAAPRSRFHVTYLVAGMPDLRTGRIADESLSLLPNCFFVRLNHREESLVGTDEKGALYSFGRKLERLSAVQVHPRESLELNFVPPSAVRESCLLFGERWQPELLAHVQAVGFAPPIRGLPITFSAKHLDKPKYADEEGKEVRRKLEAQGPLQGQLLLRPRVLVVLVDAEVLTSPPPSLRAAGPDVSFALSGAGAAIPLELEKGRRRAYRAYACTGFAGGRVVVTIPGSALASRFRTGKEVHRTIEVAFSTKTPVGDFDFHVLDFPSVEGAILTHFAELFPHVISPDDEPDPDAKPEAAHAEEGTLRARLTALVASEKDRIVAGYKSLDDVPGIPALFEKALQALQRWEEPRLKPPWRHLARAGARTVKGAVTTEHAQELGQAALEVLAGTGERGAEAVLALALEGWKSYAATTKAISTGRRLVLAKRHAAVLGLLEERIGGSLIKRLFVRNQWREHALDKLVEHAEGEKNALARYVMWRKEKVNRELLEGMVRKGVEPQVGELQRTWWARRKAGVFWALDTAVTVNQIVFTATEIMELRAAISLQHEVLSTSAREYEKRYKGRPCLAAVPRLEVLRKQADASVKAEQEKTEEILKEAASATLKTLAFIPVAREAAACTLFAGEALVAAGAVLDVVSSAVDRYLWRHRSARQRMSVLHRVHALQCRAIEACAGGPDDPHTQLRMRIIALVGLLRLVERCGSRRDEAKFREKAAQYRIDEYVKTFLAPGKPRTIPLSNGTPLDELWLYAQGNKNESWNEWFATLPKASNLVDELAPWTTRWVPTNYHDLYPVYGKDSADAYALARGFSLNFSQVADKDLAFSAVYVRRKAEEPWVLATKAPFPIGPFTPVRIVAVFKSKADLCGAPVSVQLKRVDRRYEGPVYKGSLARAVTTADGGSDKGLLPGTEEARYVGDPEAYAFVCFPFYFYKTNYVRGLKPFGTIATGTYAMEMRFDLKVGDDGRYMKVGGGAETVKLSFRQGNRYHDEMLLDTTFLAHKESGAYHTRVFVEGRVYVAGVYFLDGKNWKPYPAQGGSLLVLRAGKEFPFAWGKPFELIVVLLGERDARYGYPDPFPAKVTITTAGKPGERGPSRDVTVISLPRAIARGKASGEALSADLRAARLVVGEETVDAKDFRVDAFGSFFAFRVAYGFSVDGYDGERREIAGLKPFASEVRGQYSYDLNVQSPDPVGLSIARFVRLELPGVPRDLLANTAYEGDSRFVTDKRLWPLDVVPTLRL